MATTAKAWGTQGPTEALKPIVIERRALRPEDVAIKISHCGICHSARRLGHELLPDGAWP